MAENRRFSIFYRAFATEMGSAVMVMVMVLNSACTGPRSAVRTYIGYVMVMVINSAYTGPRPRYL